jgi:hypothetical protein
MNTKILVFFISLLLPGTAVCAAVAATMIFQRAQEPGENAFSMLIRKISIAPITSVPGSGSASALCPLHTCYAATGLSLLWIDKREAIAELTLLEFTNPKDSEIQR